MKSINFNQRKLLSLSIIASIFLLYGFFLAHQLDITNADIGRHIRSGEITVNTFEVIKKNLYSYTYPEFEIINHHWASGVLFFIIWKLTGFDGLHLFFIAVSLLSFGIFYLIAIQQAGLGIASLLSINTIFLLAHRTEIRPEVFSYLLSGVFWWALLTYRKGAIPFKHLIIALLFLEIIWVNLHIYFILGIVIIGAFSLESLFFSRENRMRMLALLTVISLATLCNPFGISGALAPLRIFDNYGFAVIENEPIWYIDQILPFTHTLFFKIEAVLVLASFALAARIRPKKISPAHCILAVFSIAAGCLAVRNFALTGLFALPIICANISISDRSLRQTQERTLQIVVLLTLALALIFTWGFNGNKLFPFVKKEIGIGLKENNSAAVEYIKSHALHGPIFNNFDIGSFLIFHLYPHERVFVDGRPEAYPADFFGSVYMPMLLSENLWSKFHKTVYHFNMIVLDHRDLSPWTQQFLNNRLNDPEWVNVYADSAVVIFVRNQSQI